MPGSTAPGPIAQGGSNLLCTDPRWVKGQEHWPTEIHRAAPYSSLLAFPAPCPWSCNFTTSKTSYGFSPNSHQPCPSLSPFSRELMPPEEAPTALQRVGAAIKSQAIQG